MARLGRPLDEAILTLRQQTQRVLARIHHHPEQCPAENDWSVSLGHDDNDDENDNAKCEDGEWFSVSPVSTLPEHGADFVPDGGLLDGGEFFKPDPDEKGSWNDSIARRPMTMEEAEKDNAVMDGIEFVGIRDPGKSIELVGSSIKGKEKGGEVKYASAGDEDPGLPSSLLSRHQISRSGSTLPTMPNTPFLGNLSSPAISSQGSVPFMSLSSSSSSSSSTSSFPRTFQDTPQAQDPNPNPEPVSRVPNRDTMQKATTTAAAAPSTPGSGCPCPFAPAEELPLAADISSLAVAVAAVARLKTTVNNPSSRPSLPPPPPPPPPRQHPRRSLRSTTTSAANPASVVPTPKETSSTGGPRLSPPPRRRR